MISGGAPGNVNEEESMNIPRDNFDLDDVRNSLIDFKQCAPPQPLQRLISKPDENNPQLHRRTSRASSFAGSSIWDEGKYLRDPVRG